MQFHNDAAVLNLDLFVGGIGVSVLMGRSGWFKMRGQRMSFIIQSRDISRASLTSN